ncbi:hypothetical protein B0H11DRAFT_1914886 [Mycena galericulata]|nr:hypothetical protein B0H11DRAFT_1914886 [Mycena galericulata]
MFSGVPLFRDCGSFLAALRRSYGSVAFSHLQDKQPELAIGTSSHPQSSTVIRVRSGLNSMYSASTRPDGARADRRGECLHPFDICTSQVAGAGDETRSIARFPRDTRRGWPTSPSSSWCRNSVKPSPHTRILTEVLGGARIHFLSVIRLDTNPEEMIIWRMARMRGAKCPASLLTVMYVISAKRWMAKVDEGRKRCA